MQVRGTWAQRGTHRNAVGNVTGSRRSNKEQRFSPPLLRVLANHGKLHQCCEFIPGIQPWRLMQYLGTSSRTYLSWVTSSMMWVYIRNTTIMINAMIRYFAYLLTMRNFINSVSFFSSEIQQLRLMQYVGTSSRTYLVWKILSILWVLIRNSTMKISMHFTDTSSRACSPCKASSMLRVQFSRSYWFTFQIYVMFLTFSTLHTHFESNFIKLFWTLKKLY